MPTLRRPIRKKLPRLIVPKHPVLPKRPRPAPSPLLLLPLRLEYRIIVGRGAAKELWVRWFPEEDFVEKGIAPATAEELAGLADFDAQAGGRLWYDTSNADVCAAWQRLALRIGAARAVHLLRDRSAGQADFQQRSGLPALSPSRVALFALNHAGSVTALGAGTKIETGLKYDPGAVGAKGWLVDFDFAVAAGMGMKVTDGTALAAALDADWIVAVGLDAKDAAGPLTELFKDWIANGSFGVLAQDAPTNNAGPVTSIGMDPRRDLLGYLDDATHLERGKLRTDVAESCDLLADSLAVDRAVLSKAVRAGDSAFEDAQAMLRVIGPSLLDIALDSLPDLSSLSETEVIEFFEDCISARGTLPLTRVGKSPYGILPVSLTEKLEPHSSDSAAAKKIHGFIRKYAAAYGKLQAQRSDELTPVIAPNDAHASEKLQEILAQYPVSRRIDVADAGSPDFDTLGCPYVAGSGKRGMRPSTYLKQLRTLPISSLPDPTALERDYPLLYRLARLSIERETVSVVTADSPERGRLRGKKSTSQKADVLQRRMTVVKNLSVSVLATQASLATQLGASTAGVVQRRSRSLDAGLSRLAEIAARKSGQAELRTLMLETLDLFQHRMDAWASGLAYRRLAHQRRAGDHGLSAGYWGLLGKLRPASVTGGTDGFIQTPGLAQATTAAVLRSAHLRFKAEGSFDLNLSSARVRSAMRMLDLVKKGLSLHEVLGLRGERWLHDQRRDGDIFVLREQFPLRDPETEESIELRLFDGLAFLEHPGAFTGDTATIQALTRLKARLKEDLDAFTDLLVCEAVHQRALGQADAANAWMKVLVGEPVPGEPMFIRTLRQGNGSSHRVVLALDPATPGATAAPRELAEPTVAALATLNLAGFAAAEADVVVEPTPHHVRVKLAADLGMTPIDLVVGGTSEINVRARAFVIDRWMSDTATQTLLGPFPATGTDSFTTQTRQVHVTLPADVLALAAKATELRRLVQRGRFLEPADLNAAASLATPLTEADEATLWSGALTALRSRGAALVLAAGGSTSALRTEVRTAVTAARNVARTLETGADVTAPLAALEARRLRLRSALVTVSRFAEPGALRPWTAVELADSVDAVAGDLEALTVRVEGKTSALSTALAAHAATPATLTDAKRGVREVSEAIRGLLDGDALPILPPFARTAATTPLVATAATVDSALAEWSPVREGVARANQLGTELTNFRAFTVLPGASGAEAPIDARPEAEAPLTRLFGVFLADVRTFATASALAGVCADEWSEQRPSSMQTTGLALNYDSPQSEPPHCLLLCVPPNDDKAPWTEAAAAEMVRETIQWMKVRALPTSQRILPGTLVPYGNEVPFSTVDGRERRRIPTGKTKLVERGAGAGFVTPVDRKRTLGKAGIGLNEIRAYRDEEG